MQKNKEQALLQCPSCGRSRLCYACCLPAGQEQSFTQEAPCSCPGSWLGTCHMPPAPAPNCHQPRTGPAARPCSWVNPLYTESTSYRAASRFTEVGETSSQFRASGYLQRISPPTIAGSLYSFFGLFQVLRHFTKTLLCLNQVLAIAVRSAHGHWDVRRG